MNDLIFATTAYSGRAEVDALMLARSLREFGGKYADCPFWIAVPENNNLHPTVLQGFEALDVRLVSFELDESEMRFLYAPKTIAAGVVEAAAVGKTEVLAWLDNTCFILNEPESFLLPETKSFGWRPVDHRNIGSLYDEPLDDFWTLIYQDCAVPADKVFRMKPAADEQMIRPYYNAGISIVRPERGILHQTAAKFREVYQKPGYQAFYEADAKYQVFMHQAIYSGVVLNMLDQVEMLELPRDVNYSLILHEDYPEGQMAALLNDLVSVRHEGFLEYEGWEKRINIQEPLKTWLQEQLQYKAEVLNG